MLSNDAFGDFILSSSTMQNVQSYFQLGYPKRKNCHGLHIFFKSSIVQTFLKSYNKAIDVSFRLPRNDQMHVLQCTVFIRGPYIAFLFWKVTSTDIFFFVPIILFYKVTSLH